MGSVFIKTNIQSKMMNTLKGLGHAILGNFVEFCWLWAPNVKLAEQGSFICKIRATQQLRAIFQLCKWHFDINWYEFEKSRADVFQIYPKAIHFNLLQFCPSMSLLGFPVFCWSSSIVLSRYFDILVNSMTIWSVLKLPKIAWPSPFKYTLNQTQNVLIPFLKLNCDIKCIVLNPHLYDVITAALRLSGVSQW